MKFLPLAAFLFVTACAHDLALMKREEALHAYGAAIRWSSFDTAARFQSARTRGRPLPDSLQDVKVSGYHVLTQTADKERMSLSRIVEIHYYREGYLVEKTLRDEELWHYDEDAGEWRIDTPLPRFP